MLLCPCSEPDEEVPASVYLAVASVSPRATQEQLDAAEVRQREMLSFSSHILHWDACSTWALNVLSMLAQELLDSCDGQCVHPLAMLKIDALVESCLAVSTLALSLSNTHGCISRRCCLQRACCDETPDGSGR